MRKKYLSALLFGALLLASAGTFTSCKDYDDDIKNLQEQINTVKTSLDELTTKVNNLGAGVKEFKYENGKLILVTDKDTNFEVELPACEGIKELTIKNGILYADGVEVGPIGGEGTTIEGDKVEVIDGVLYINGEAKDLKDEVGSNVAVYDNGSTYIMTVDGVSYVLPKASAGLTSLKFEEDGDQIFKGYTQGNNISWNVAATDVADWAGKKGAVKRNQLLVGQISTLTVQVTPASFDLGSMELSLKDSKGNEAPVNVYAVKNNLLLTRSAANSGSWVVSIDMKDDVTVDNIATVFDADSEKAPKKEILYALCIDGAPVSNYDITIETRTAATNPDSKGWNHGAQFSGFEFVDEDGYKNTIDAEYTVSGDVKENVPTSLVDGGELPMGETVLTPLFTGTKLDHLYDSYITFEGTNISLAKSKGIVADGMKITAPASAAGTQITASVYFMDITGKVTKSFITFTVAASTAESIAATPVDYKVMPAKVISGKSIELANIEIKDLNSVFAKIDAATLEKAKKSGKLSIVEEKDQKGFFIASDNDGKFDPAQYEFYKANGEAWDVTTDDLSELASIKFDMNKLSTGTDGNNNTYTVNKVAKDAKPGTYNLYFVVKDEDNENEIIRVKMEVKVSKPTFGELFSSNNWVDGKYVARIVASGRNQWGSNDAAINLSKAYVAMPNTKADPAQLAYAFQAIGEGADKKYAVTNLDDAYNGDLLNAISGKAGLAILNKEVVYKSENSVYKSLALSEIEGMVAYTSVLAGLQAAQVETTQGLNIADAIETIQEQFTVSSSAYTTKLETALNGVKPVYYVNKVDQLASAGYVIPLTKDGDITPLSFDTDDQTKPLNGFGIELNGDIVSAYYAGAAVKEPVTSHMVSVYELDGYALRTNTPSGTTYPLYDVVFDAQISEGQIDWTNANGEAWFKVTQLPNAKSATVTITLKDATGMIYELPVNVVSTND